MALQGLAAVRSIDDRAYNAPESIAVCDDARRDVVAVYRRLCADGAAPAYALHAALDAFWAHHPDLGDDVAGDAVLSILQAA